MDGFDGVGLARAFGPIADSLRDDRFAEPAQGWTAEQVAAHLVLNNECWTDVVTRVGQGEAPAYSNESAVDPDVLTEYAVRVGSLEALADRVVASAHELETAFVALTPEQRDQLVPVTVLHAGDIVVEGPHQLGTFVEINATRHVAMHLDQLLALRG